MTDPNKIISNPPSNGYEYDCESYSGNSEEELDKRFPGWRDPVAKQQQDDQKQA